MSARREFVALLVLVSIASVAGAVSILDGAVAAAIAVAVAATAGAAAWWLGSQTSRPAAADQRDDLTGLPVRAALSADVDGFLATREHADQQLTLHMFDLVGFKKYNDAFGFAAGDALLRHLAQRLSTSIGHRARVYRLRGAQFALIDPGPIGNRNELRSQAATHLREVGEGFLVECASSTVVIPRQARNVSEALKLADHELQAERAALRRLGLDEGTITPNRAVGRLPGSPYEVSNVAESVSQTLGLDHDEIEVVHAAITWRDVGMMAIPDAILTSEHALTAEHWRYVRLHTLIGERLLRSNFGLHRVAGVVRSSHERWDGTGYPDGLHGHDIPLVARIVFVCSAFEDMTSPRAHRRALPMGQALDELRRHAGAQFDPQVVAAFAGAFSESPVASDSAVS